MIETIKNSRTKRAVESVAPEQGKSKEEQILEESSRKRQEEMVRMRRRG
jgi:hypothetical protein